MGRTVATPVPIGRLRPIEIHLKAVGCSVNVKLFRTKVGGDA